MGQQHHCGFLSSIIRRLGELADCQGISRDRRTHRILAVVFLSSAVVGHVYRGYVWSHGIQDLGLADAWPNIVAVPIMVFAEMGFKTPPPEGMWTPLIGAVGGLILYEFSQLTGYLDLVFDWRDVAGTLLGIPVTVIAYQCARRQHIAP